MRLFKINYKHFLCFLFLIFMLVLAVGSNDSSKGSSNRSSDAVILVNTEEYFLNNYDYSSLRKSNDTDDFGEKLFSGTYKHIIKMYGQYIDKTLKYAISFNKKTNKYYWINISDTSYLPKEKVTFDRDNNIKREKAGWLDSLRVNKLAFRFSKQELLTIKDLAKKSLENKFKPKEKTIKPFKCRYFECRRVDASDKDLIWTPIMDFTLRVGAASDTFMISPSEITPFEYEMGTSGFSTMVFDKECLKLLYDNLEKYIK